jgi:hypothetical protein
MSELLAGPATRWVRAAVVISMLLFAASLVTPAIRFALVHGHHPHPRPSDVRQVESKTGFAMLFSSLFGPFYLNFAGVANPLLIVAWWLLWYRRSNAAPILLVVALLLSLQTFQLYQSGIAADEGGVMYDEMLRPLVGFYLWVASMAVPLVASLLQRRTVR